MDKLGSLLEVLPITESVEAKLVHLKTLVDTLEAELMNATPAHELKILNTKLTRDRELAQFLFPYYFMVNQLF